MRELLTLATSSFVLALLLTPFFRNIFARHGILDHPDTDRKLHVRPVPHLGGVPLVTAYAVSFAAMFLFGHKGVETVNFSLAFKLVPAVAIIFGCGVLDDIYGLQPIQKLLAQIAAAVVAYFAGVQVTGVTTLHFPVWLSAIVTIIWLIGCANAFNLIDGVDGLATGVGLFATATMLVAALMQQNLGLAIATAPLAGALLGFLRYNFNPATIFLGDSGSLTIGFLLGCFGAIWSQKAATVLGMTAPLMALSIPILDACLAVVRRFLRRQPIFRGDSGHIHHRLLAMGFSQRRAVLLLYGFCALGAVFSIFQSVSNHYTGAAILVFCAAAWVGIQHLGYVEFDQARRMILRRGFRETLHGQLTLRGFEKSYAAAITDEQRWAVLKETCKSLGFAEVRWRTRNAEYHEAIWTTDGPVAWTVHVPFDEHCFLELTRASDTESVGINISTLAEVMRRTVGAAAAKADDVSTFAHAGD